ncbi:hypothetical protein ACOMHN_006779 [Nucella lapillus]
MVGLTLTAFFYMDILLCCGDVESNPGPLPPRSNSTSRSSSVGWSTSSMRQARLTEDSAIRRASSADLDPRSTTAGEETTDTLSIKNVVDMLTNMNKNMDSRFDKVTNDIKNVNDSVKEIKDDFKQMEKTLCDLCA